MFMTVVLECPVCGKSHSVSVDYRDYYSWRNGELVQRAFPYLTTSEREQLVSQICPECQEKIFGSDDEESEDDYFYEAF